MRRTAHLSLETKDKAQRAAEPRDGGLSFTELLDGMADELQRRTREARAGLSGRKRKAADPDKPPQQTANVEAIESPQAMEPAPTPPVSEPVGTPEAPPRAPETLAAEEGRREPRPGSDAALNEAISLVSQRLDDLNRKMAEGRQPSATGGEAASQDHPGPEPKGAAPNAPEAAAEAASAASEPIKSEGATNLDHVLRGFADGIAQAGARSARAPKALGRRGLDAADEIRNAVVSIRARQRELDASDPAPAAVRQRPPAPPAVVASARSQADVVASVKADVARIAGQLDALQAAPAAAPDSLTALLAEIGHVQDSLGGVATRTDVNAVEKAVRDLGARMPAAGSLQHAGAPGDAGLRSDLDRLSGDISANVHGRISRDLERLTRKMDAVSGLAQNSHAIETVARQLPAMQRRLEELGELRRLQEAVDRVADLGPQIAELRHSQHAGSVRPLLEEIRAGLDRSRLAAGQIGPDLSSQLDLLGEKIDDLRRENAATDVAGLSRRIEALSRTIEADRALPVEILDRVEDLSSRLDLAASAPADLAGAMDRLSDRVEGALARTIPDTALETVLARLDRIDERLRRKPGDPSSLEEMLRSLADKLEAAESPVAEAAALDALETQVGAISARLSAASGRDPAIAALERAMGDLSSQVSALREGEAATGGSRPTYQALERDLAEIKAKTSAQDRRFQSMLAGVQQTIEGLANRFTSGEASARGADPSRDKRGASQARPTRAPADPGRSEPVAPACSPSEEALLEPGFNRQRNALSVATRDPQAGSAVADTKASFIAAARRAAQTAAAEAGQRRTTGRPEAGGAGVSRRPDRTGVASRMTRAFTARRRQALLGLAAVVLALGALQAKTGLLSQKLAGIADQQRTTPSRANSDADAAAEARFARITPAVGEPAPVAAAKTPAAVARAEPLPTPQAAPETVAAAPKTAPAAQEAKAEAPTPQQTAPIETAAKPQSLVTGSIEPAAPKAPPTRVANVAAVGEIPSVSDAPGLKPAALSGDAVAVFELATRAAEGRGVARDPKLAAKLFEKAAASGVVPAQYRIGNQYEKGIGVARDLGLAKLWYQRAAESGNAKAMHNLAVLLADGGGASPDYGSAGAWFRAAAERGVRDSQYNLAVLYTRGLGLKQDLVLSYTWFAIAAGQGDQDAAKKRDEVGQRLSAKDLAAAKEASQRWRPQGLDQAANEVVLPAGGWPEVAAKRGPVPKKA